MSQDAMPHDATLSAADLLRETTEAQHAASDPLASAWVGANAGAGKTHVLKMRVLRLLLAGVLPERILCLTYTKAAAAEMAQRVFRELADWSTMDPAALARELANCSGGPLRQREPGGAAAVRARDRDTRRPQGADHPRVLRAVAATVPARGKRAARFHDPRRRDGRRTDA